MTPTGRAWLTEVPIAHRGLHGPNAPELSRAAVGLAVDAGYAVEIDVRASRDGILLALHDVDTDRVTDTRLIVAETDAAALTSLRLTGSSETVLTLAEVLAIVDARVPLLIEVKHGVAAQRVGPLVMAIMARYHGQWAIESFDPRIVWWFRRHARQVLRGQLSGDLSAEPIPMLRRLLLEVMAFNVVTRPDFLVYDVDALPRLAVTLWRATLRCPLVVWTASTPGHVRLARRLRAGMIFEQVVPERVDSATRT